MIVQCKTGIRYPIIMNIKFLILVLIVMVFKLKEFGGNLVCSEESALWLMIHDEFYFI